MEWLKYRIKSKSEKATDNVYKESIAQLANGGAWAIQGFEGSFHQEAARVFLGKQVEVLTCHTFREVIAAAANKKLANGGVMAIENSIAGSILPNYNLLQKSNLQIVGEVYLQIRQNLLANKEVKLEDIREVHSHTMALQQCYDYLDKYKWKLVDSDDTALSAKHIAQNKSKTIAAIASKLAAELYDLQILQPDIHSIKNNYTRFLFLTTKDKAPEIKDASKASLSFQVSHKSGSLAKVLTKVADAKVNLSKLQSFPIPGSDFSYMFHADMEFEKMVYFDKMMKSIKTSITDLKLYGVYKNGKLAKNK